MPLLRIHKCSSLNLWEKPPAEIAAEWFDRFKDSRPSLYEANNPFEEVEAVAAFALTNLGKPAAYHVMRIDPEELAWVGIAPSDETPGNTGVVSVDFRHWEIPVDEKKLVGLLSHIRQRVVTGEERLRWIGVLSQEEYWRRFLAFPASQVIKEAQRRCTLRLEKNSNQPAFNRRQIESELAIDQPAIPSRWIRPRAFLKFMDRQRRSSSGSPDEDWAEAEKESRQSYVQGILRYGTSS